MNKKKLGTVVIVVGVIATLAVILFGGVFTAATICDDTQNSYIIVQTNPDDAAYYINDVYIGQTDLQNTLNSYICHLPEGTYTIKIVKSGYQTIIETHDLGDNTAIGIGKVLVSN